MTTLSRPRGRLQRGARGADGRHGRVPPARGRAPGPAGGLRLRGRAPQHPADGRRPRLQRAGQRRRERRGRRGHRRAHRRDGPDARWRTTESFFPNYALVPVVRAEVLEANPEIGTLLEDLSGRLDDATMQRLNGMVDVEGISVEQVAEAYLIRAGPAVMDGAPARGAAGAPVVDRRPGDAPAPSAADALQLVAGRGGQFPHPPCRDGRRGDRPASANAPPPPTRRPPPPSCVAWPAGCAAATLGITPRVLARAWKAHWTVWGCVVPRQFAQVASGLEMACLDLCGKLSGRPVWDLLGGAVRAGCRVLPLPAGRDGRGPRRRRGRRGRARDARPLPQGRRWARRGTSPPWPPCEPPRRRPA